MTTTASSIPEPSIQDALVAWLSARKSVSGTLLQRLGFTDHPSDSHATLVSATRGVWGHNGESDVVAEWCSAEGKRLKLLIEVKLAAGFMDQQGARYQARAASLLAEAEDLVVRCILVAPATYLRRANPQALKFDQRLPLEFFVEAGGPHDPSTRIMSDALQRLADGKPLGAKGLYPDLHGELQALCERRENGLSVQNNATAWITLKGARWPVGVNLNYRIENGVAEIRVLQSYKGPRDVLHEADESLLRTVQSGGELFLKHKRLQVSDSAKTGRASDADLEAIVSALEDLQTWWFDHAAPSRRSAG